VRHIYAALFVLIGALSLSCSKTHVSATPEGMFASASSDTSVCRPGIKDSRVPPRPIHDRRGMVWIRGGEFSMGSSNPAFDDARPWHRVRVDGFWIDTTTVTNEEFARFVRATHYVTVAERKPSPADFPNVPPQKLAPGSLVFTPPAHPVELNDDRQWWKFVKGADWRHPEGPKSSIVGRDKYPVVQVAFEDAQAYARWVGKRLPTEAEYEYAERGGLDCKPYAWGDAFTPHDKQMANTFHGHFPDKSTAKNNHPDAMPVGSFPPNGYGLFDMSGNVWEWTSDWYRPDYYMTLAAKHVAVNPQGPPWSFDPKEPGVAKRAVRGGSFLCTDQFCSRYEVGGRGQDEPNSSANHIGFRLVD
jgi:sulfatase modifying factor 1